MSDNQTIAYFFAIASIMCLGVGVFVWSWMSMERALFRHLLTKCLAHLRTTTTEDEYRQACKLCGVEPYDPGKE